MSLSVLDPFGIGGDAAMPSLALALDPVEVQRRFGRGLRRLAGNDGFVHLRAIRVTRYKPGRRCVIEYDIDVERAERPLEQLTLIGKVRRHRFGMSGFRLLSALWDAGFSDTSADGISVPEPVGTVGDLRMWLQRKVEGQRATELLASPGGVPLGRRIAEAAQKVHQAGVPPESRHTMADELRILREALYVVIEAYSRWARRLEHLLQACDRLGEAMPKPAPRTIHRDFYADQVIVDGERLYLIDFDEYCEGDPALDIGNFLGAMTEQSLRTYRDPDALAHVERAIEDRFVELSGEETRARVRGYGLLTLARHIFISTRFPERRPFTGAILDLCEERMAVALDAL